jgi:hypothetical protein
MLFISSLWRPPTQPNETKPLSSVDRLIVIAYVTGWLALGIALYAYWFEWSAPVKYTLAVIEAVLAPDLSGLRSVFSSRFLTRGVTLPKPLGLCPGLFAFPSMRFRCFMLRLADSPSWLLIDSFHAEKH